MAKAKVSEILPIVTVPEFINLGESIVPVYGIIAVDKVDIKRRCSFRVSEYLLEIFYANDAEVNDWTVSFSDQTRRDYFFERLVELLVNRASV